MPDPPIASISIERDVRIHSSLRHASGVLLDKGRADPAGSLHEFMASIVFSAFTMEAYLNWLGEKLFAHWRYLEKLSPKEKLDLLADQLNVSVDFGRRPWQTMKTLFNFRNTIGHGKSETLTSDTVHSLDEFGLLRSE